MEFINGMLIHGAEAVLGLWEAVVEHGGELLSVLDRLLNPILSPVLGFLNPVCTAVADVVYTVLHPVPIGAGLTLLSAALGVIMLFVFRHLSNQAKIGRAKDDIKANLLALKLFKDDLRVMFGAQFRIAWAIVRLQRYLLTPVLWSTFPMLLVLAQMGIRYQWRPLLPGEASLIRVVLNEPKAQAKSVTLDADPGVVVEVGPVPGHRDWVWRIRGGQPGRHTLRFHLDGKDIEKELVVGEPGQRVSAVRTSAHWTEQLFHPAERRLPADTGLQRIEIEYPSVHSWFQGADYWVVTFFVISMAAALILAPVFRVRF